MAKKQSSHRALKAMFALLLLTGVAVGGWLWQQYKGFADTPIALAGTERILVVERGDGFQDILDKLRGLGVSEGHDLEWKALAHEMQVISRLQVGDYSIRHGITPRELLAKLESGKVIQHRFTIVEGWNIRELRAALAKAKPLEQESAALDDAARKAGFGTVIESRPMRKRPDVGLVRTIWEMFNQDGEKVLHMEGYGMFRRREPAQ